MLTHGPPRGRRVRPALHALYLRLGGDPVHTTARAVCEVAGVDTVARHAVVVAATALGRTVGGVANMLDPEVVVISGGLAGAGALWWDTMSAALASELMPPLDGLPVVAATLGGDAAVLGRPGSRSPRTTGPLAVPPPFPTTARSTSASSPLSRPPLGSPEDPVTDRSSTAPAGTDTSPDPLAALRADWSSRARPTRASPCATRAP
ncbi:ROK family protein [Oerskovia sp. M15]